MLEVVPYAVPPDSLVEHAVRVPSGELYWVRTGGLSIRCEPRRRDRMVKLLAAIEGRIELRQHGRTATLEPGAFTWVDADEPFEMRCDPRARQLQLRWSLEAIRRRHPDLDVRSAVARGQDHAGERIIRDLLRALAHDGPSLPSESCLPLACTVLESLGLARQRDARQLAEERATRALRDIEARLHDPDLDPIDVAHRQGVSRRYLDGIVLQHRGETLSTVIRRRRLERAAEELATRPGTAIEATALRWGFRDASHFSRVFRARFGCSPSTYGRSSTR